MLVLMDTGPWVALVDRSEERHKKCVEWLKDFKGNILSSEAVLTEVLYLLNFSPRAQSAAIDFVLNEAIMLVPSSLESLKRVKRLMDKYQDIPMDYADATLVSIAEDLSITHVVSFDAKDFGIYRISSKQPFVVLPR
jgi:predicted nucleic acid-binding protein